MAKKRKPKQLVMTYGTWGGWRPGAGRKPSKRRNKRVLHRKRPAITRRNPVHISLEICTVFKSLRTKKRAQGCQIPGDAPSLQHAPVTAFVSSTGRFKARICI